MPPSPPRLPGLSYAAQGLALPARRLTTAPIQGVRPAPLPDQPAVLGNLSGWIVPQAQVRWLGPGVAWYSPQRVEQIFRQALAGDLCSQWEMFDLMESTWPRLSKNLNQIKDAVIAEGIRVEPWCAKGQQPTDTAQARAALVEAALFNMRPRMEGDENDFEDTLRDLLDARGKGISVLEVEWETRETNLPVPKSSEEQSAAPKLPGSAFIAAPRCTRWVHPVWYGYPYGPGSGDLKLRVPKGVTYQPQKYFPGDTSLAYQGVSPGLYQDFPADKFLIGLCKNKTGHPLGAAMLHVLGFWWAASNFTAEWFLNFCQVFGQPFRWATYDPSMTPADQVKLQAMLTSMGAQAWGMFPAGTSFELKDVASGASDNIQARLLDIADKICDLLVLRQTLTSDVGDTGSGSRALGEVHERVLGGVEYTLARWACKTLLPLARSICRLNFGNDRECPLLQPGMDLEAEGAVSFKRDVLKTFLADGTVNDVLANLTDLKALVRDAGLPVNEEYVEPYLPVLAQPGQKVTGGTVLDEEGDIVGGATKESEAEPLDLQPPSPNGQDEDDNTEANEENKGKVPENGEETKATTGAEKTPRAPKSDPTDSAVAAKAKALGEAYQGAMAPFRQILLDSHSPEQALVQLARAYADWSPQRLAAELEEALQLCAAAATVAADVSRR